MLRWTLHLRKRGTKNPYTAAVAVGQTIYVFGGHGTVGGHMWVHVFNTVSLSWVKTPPLTTRRGESRLEVPSMRRGQTAVLVQDGIYVWGGSSSRPSRSLDKGVLDELYAFDLNTHRWLKPQASGSVPEARYGHSACVLGKVMYIHGGITQPGSTNDIDKLDTTSMVWSVINTRGNAPPASSHHSSTIIGTKMFVFGGHQGDIRVFDTETDCWLNVPANLHPEGRRWTHSAFAYNDELYICGGKYSYNVAKPFDNVLWKFNPENFSWKRLDSGEVRGEAPTLQMDWMCSCRVGDRIVVLGGYRTLSGSDVSCHHHMHILDLSPSLKTLCKLAVIQYGLDRSELPHDIRWELAAMTTDGGRKYECPGC